MGQWSLQKGGGGNVYIPIAALSYILGVAYYSLRPKIVDVLALGTRIKEKWKRRWMHKNEIDRDKYALGREKDALRSGNDKYFEKTGKD
jgi:hypothetical protein